MKVKNNDGGAAFPLPVSTLGERACDSSAITHQTGMTLRDYFAAKAMQGMLAACDGWLSDQDASEVARRTYLLSDAMIAERAK